jgi:hypothetical protein
VQRRGRQLPCWPRLGSRCALNAESSPASVTATDVVLSLAFFFSAHSRGTNGVFSYVQDKSGAGSGWRQNGAWIVS